MTGKDYDQSKNLKITQQQILNDSIYRRYLEELTASLVAQLLKNAPAMWEVWVRSLAWEDPMEKGKATHSSILAWRVPWTL